MADFVDLRRLSMVILIVLNTMWLGSVWAAGEAAPLALLDVGNGQKYGRSKYMLAPQQRFTIRKAAIARMKQQHVENLSLPAIGKNLVFSVSARRKNNKDIVTWTGRSADESASVVMTVGDGHFFAMVYGEGDRTVYRPFPGRDEMIVEKLDPALAANIEHDFLLQAQGQIPFADLGAEVSVRSAAGASGLPTLIDVMVLYTNGMGDQHPGSQIATRVQHLVDIANNIFSNTELNVRYNLVHSDEVNYPDNTSLDAALVDLTNSSGVFVDVENLRDQYGADQVTLLRQYVNDGCGLAWLMQNVVTPAFAVVHDGMKTDGSGWYCTDSTFAHELGHNLGCAHDIVNAISFGIFDYSYGYQHPGGAFRTVMAYPDGCPGACPEIAYFSSPDVSWNGWTIGVANQNDNARTIRQTAVIIAERKAAVAPNIILSFRDHDFGQVFLGEEISAQALYISKDGPGALVIGDVQDEFLEPFVVAVDNCSNTILATGEHCIMYLDLVPSAPGQFIRWFSIPSNDPYKNEASVELRATVVSNEPFISLSPLELRFATTPPGSSEAATVRATNLGRTDLVFGLLAGKDGLEPPFSLVADACSRATLAEGENCTFAIQYSPQNKARAIDWLDIPSNDPRQPSSLFSVEGGRSFPWPVFYPALLRASPDR